MKSFIIPYIHIGGVPNFEDGEVMDLFYRMQKDGSLEIVFFDGSIKTGKDFLNFMNKEGVQLYLVYIKGDPLPMGFVWLDQFMYKTAHGHFCAFSEYWGQLYPVGREVATRLITYKDAEGNYALDAIYGLVPKDNEMALKAAEAAGVKIAGTLPYAFYFEADKKSHHGVIFYFTRDELSEEELRERTRNGRNSDKKRSLWI